MTLERLRRLDAIVFDMDGVLLDSEPLHLAALNRVIATEGHALTEAQNLQFVGLSLADTWTTLIRELQLCHDIEHYYRCYDAEVLGVLGAGPLEPLPGVRELIAALRGVGMRLGLATQSKQSWVQATLGGLGLHDAFDVIISGEMVARGKPEPDLYLLACEWLGAEPARSLALEDSVPGARAARAAGMAVVGVRNAYHGEALEREADLVVDRVDQLLDPATVWPPRLLHRTITRSGDRQ